MNQAPHEYDPATTAKLRRLAGRVEKVHARFAELDDDNDPDGTQSVFMNTADPGKVVL